MNKDILKQTKSRTAANDNARIRGLIENAVPLSADSHVYVQNAENSPVSPPSPGSCLRARSTSWRPTRITTNLPENLPILAEELALVQGYLADLVSSILANDNEPE